MIGALLLAVAAPPAERPNIVTREVETGSRIAVTRDQSATAVDGRNRAKMLRGMSECVIRRQRGVAMRVIAASAGDALDYGRLGIPAGRLNLALSIDTCLEQSLTYDGMFQWRSSTSMLRNLLVDALYRATFVTPPVKAWAEVVAQPVAAIGNAARVQAQQAVGAFGECIARADFAASDRLVRSEPTSDAERAAFAAIVPLISPCIEAGSSVSLAKPALRIIITDAAWRLANGASSVPGAKAN